MVAFGAFADDEVTELWSAEGTTIYGYDPWDGTDPIATFPGTIIAYSDGTYTIKDFWGVKDNDYSFTIKEAEDENNGYYMYSTAGASVEWIYTGLDNDGVNIDILYAYLDSYSYFWGDETQGYLYFNAWPYIGDGYIDYAIIGFEWPRSEETSSELTAESLVGEYTAVTSAYEESYDWDTYQYYADPVTDLTYDVTIELGETSDIVIKNFYWEADVNADLVADSRELTFPIQQPLEYYYFCKYEDDTLNWITDLNEVTATIDEKGVITVQNWAFAYDYEPTYGSQYAGYYWPDQCNSITVLTPKSDAINTIATDLENVNAPVEYYNIQGVRVANPAKGQLVIKRQGNKASKIIF